MNKNPFGEDGNKKCPGCGEVKHQDEYYNTKATVNGKVSRCKVCVDASNKAWQEANPEKYAGSQRAWREANEGYTYVETASGYVIHIGYAHPIANPSGVTPYHRIVLWNEIGPGEHECYWKCGKTVSWDVSYLEDVSRALVVDHLNGIRDDNRPENLVPSCQSCNSGVSRLSRKVIVDCAFEGCDREATTKGHCKTHNKQLWDGKELKPIRRRIIAFQDENGRVCTECNEYKTYDYFTLNSNGKPRSKCGKCSSSLTMKTLRARKAQEVAA
ncbi:hypothetical protein [Streptomyces sp. NPDC059513]|uniref:hypothetical protein n=1 Tax=unclassified Streptomyces TaxID=2593676 RepID=UPI00369E69D9